MLDTTRHSKILPGLADKSIEFFVHQNEVKCLHDGRVYVFDNMPSWILDLVTDDMLKHPEAIKALAKWENLTEKDRVRQYIYCRFGGLDNEADIDEAGNFNYAEYFDCGMRGSCKYEGKLCCSLQVANGYLTKTEVQVLKRIAQPDKIIAAELNVSTDTINTHLQNIRAKTGMASKVELAILAAKKGII